MSQAIRGMWRAIAGFPKMKARRARGMTVYRLMTAKAERESMLRIFILIESVYAAHVREEQRASMNPTIDRD